MPHVTFTRHLQRFFPTLGESEEVPGATVRDILHELDRRYPGFSGYIVDELGRLRRHVNGISKLGPRSTASLQAIPSVLGSWPISSDAGAMAPGTLPSNPFDGGPRSWRTPVVLRDAPRQGTRRNERRERGFYAPRFAIRR